MIRLYQDEGLTMQQIAQKFGLSRQAVHCRLTRAGVQSRPSWQRHPRMIDRETLVRLYTNEQIPVSKLARMLKTDARTIERELKRHSIERRPKNYERRKPSALDNLQVGESALISFQMDRIPYVNYYLSAKVRKIKVSIRRIETGQVQVTRIE
jgi:IS30 family transposase